MEEGSQVEVNGGEFHGEGQWGFSSGGPWKGFSSGDPWRDIQWGELLRWK